MLYVHENNIIRKINENHRGVGEKIKEFYETVYLETKMKLLKFDFSNSD